MNLDAATCEPGSADFVADAALELRTALSECALWPALACVLRDVCPYVHSYVRSFLRALLRVRTIYMCVLQFGAVPKSLLLAPCKQGDCLTLNSGSPTKRLF